MGAEAKIVSPLSIPVLDVQYRCIAQGTNLTKIEDVVEISSPRSPVFHQIHSSESVLPADKSRPDADVRSPDTVCHGTLGSAILQFVPNIRSGSCAEIGPRHFMEDEHIRIDDLSSHLGSLFRCPAPSAFYGVFDGHEGPDAAAYVRRNMIRFIFEEVDFPQTSEVNDVFIGEVENSLRKAYLLADIALADDGSVSSSSGTTALTALIFGRHLLVANAGDCRAVLCRKGEAIEMSQDHRPICPSERRRVEELGGSVDAGGYLNGTLSVSRALGDWKMKFPRGSPSPLIAEPEFRQAILTEDDEFLIIGCDGIWDVMSSQKAVGLVRRGLRRHDDPDQCAKDLVTEATRLNAFDNLTVIVVCFSSSYTSLHQRPQRRRCILSPDAVRSLMSLLNGV